MSQSTHFDAPGQGRHTGTTMPQVMAGLEASGFGFEVWPCDDKFADTASFCARYQVPPENSVNAILVVSKNDASSFALCMVPANRRLDVNGVVRKRLGAKKASFASAETTKELTGMEIGGVTPIGLPAGVPVWVEAGVMALDYVILGGGNRTSKLKVPRPCSRQSPTARSSRGLQSQGDSRRRRIDPGARVDVGTWSDGGVWVNGGARDARADARSGAMASMSHCQTARDISRRHGHWHHQRIFVFAWRVKCALMMSSVSLPPRCGRPFEGRTPIVYSPPARDATAFQHHRKYWENL